jgi:hypothetical protein
MKKVRFIVCAVMVLVLFSCEKAPKETLESDWVKSLPESVAWENNESEFYRHYINPDSLG